MGDEPLGETEAAGARLVHISQLCNTTRLTLEEGRREVLSLDCETGPACERASSAGRASSKTLTEVDCTLLELVVGEALLNSSEKRYSTPD